MHPFLDTFEGYVYSEWYSKAVNANIIGDLMRVSFVPLQFVRKLKVKGEQHIMRSVPFHYIIPFLPLVMQAVYSRSDWLAFLLIKKPYKFALFLLFLCMYYFYALLRRFDPLFERGRKVGYTVKVKPNVIICIRKI